MTLFGRTLLNGRNSFSDKGVRKIRILGSQDEPGSRNKTQGKIVLSLRRERTRLDVTQKWSGGGVMRGATHN